MKLINFVRDNTLVNVENIIGVYKDHGNVVQIDVKHDIDGYCIEGYTYTQVVNSIKEALLSSNTVTTAKEC